MSETADNKTQTTGPKAATLAQILRPARLTRIVDIGANPIDGEPPYKLMLERGLCHLTGFEPQVAALARLNAAKGKHELYLPFAVGDGTRRTLHICHAPGMTSLLKPNPQVLAMFNRFPALGMVTGSVDIDTRRLDDIDEIETIDLLKIDVQGSELSVFRNGCNKLRNAVAIHTEVSFIPLYENQPTFADIDLELRALGFIPHCFADLRQATVAPIVFDNDPSVARNQIIEADIVYVRDFSKPDLLSTEQLQHLALISHYCYGSYDLAGFCVRALVARGAGNDLDTRYLTSLMQSGRVQRVGIDTAAGPVVSKTEEHLRTLSEEAKARHRNGDLAGAENLYRSYIEASPDNAEMLTLLGTLSAQKGDFQEAIALLERSLGIDGGQWFALNSLGNALNSSGRHSEALEAFDKSLAVKTHAAAQNNRGTALRGLHRPEDALTSIDEAIVINPEYAEAFHNRGLALCDLHRPEEALESFDRAIEIKGEFPDAHRSRGNALRDLKRFEDALKSYARAIELNPQFAECFLDEGLALEEAGRRADALERYKRATALKPDLPAAHYNAGNVLAAAHRHQEALGCYERAIALKPDYAEAYNNLAGSLRALNRHVDALAASDKAIALKPGFANAHLGRANVLRDMRRHDQALVDFDRVLVLEPACAEAHRDRGIVLLELGRYADALTSFDRALECNPALPELRGLRWGTRLSICDWREIDKEADALRTAVGRRLAVSTPFSFITVPCGPDLQRKCAEAFMEGRFASAPVALRAVGELREPGRIRLAYLSADFRSHAVGFLIAGMIEAHDRDKFEIFGISTGRNDQDPMRARLRAGFEHFMDVTDMSDEAVVSLLRAKQIDVAVDLMGFTRDSRLGVFAARPAPVQVNYLGNPGTMAADFFDYIIADRIVIPESEQRFYSEKVVYMPDTYQCSDSKRVIGRTPSRRAVGLPDDAFVFSSFNRSDKITPEMFDIWMRLLQQTERSALWLRQWNAVAADSLRHHAKARGVAPERLVFAPAIAIADHLARHRLADLFLDTLPFGAHTTASDALWTGLPVLTCEGNTFPGRVAASLLNAIGLPELVTASLGEYEARALELARNPDALASIRRKLQRNRETHPLFDTVRYTRNLEAAYAQMVEHQRSGRAPESFAVQEQGALLRVAPRH